MEDNQPVTPQEPQVVQSPMTPKKSNVLLIVIGVIVILGIGLLGGYVLFANKNTSQNMSQISNVTPTTIQQPSQAVDQTANWQTYTDNKTFSMSYPPTWKMEKGGSSQVGALLYDPTTKYTVTGNGGGQIVRYKEYVAIYSVEKSTKTALQVAQEFKDDWKKLHTTIDIQNVDNGNTSIAMYQDAGEGSQGYNYTVSNGSLLAKLNTSASTLQGNTTAHSILESFKFLNSTSSTSSQVNGAGLYEIKYTLPPNWDSKISENNSLMLSPKSGGGYLSIKVYDYPGTSGRREYYCQINKVCIEGTTKYTEMNIGNISGYMATGLDNSGGGSEYFGAKGNKFYIIGTYNPPSPNDFENSYKQVLNSLVF